MREQFVSFKTAKLAKEKRFNGKCTKVYVEEYTSYNVVKGYETHKNCLFPFCLHSISNEDTSSIEESDKVVATAPTQSLLQKWLREKYKIHIEIRHTDKALTKYGFNIYNTFKDFVQCMIDNIETNESIFYNTYEEALEKALYQALLLIK